MSDFFREVDEEIRRDQMKQMWDRFGPAFVGIAVLIVLAVGGYRFWQWYEARTANAAGEVFYSVVNQADATPETVAAELRELSEGSTGFKTLARLRTAGALAEAGETDQAVSAFDAIAEDGSVPDLLRALARVRASYLLIDTADVGLLKRRVEDLTAPDSTFRHSAREIIGLAAYRQGEYTEAATWFDAIMADPATPQDMRNRTELMQALLDSRVPAQDGGAAQ